MKKLAVVVCIIICSASVAAQDLMPLKKLSRHSAGVTALAYSPDGKTLITGSEDKTILIWNTTSWECSKPISGHTNSVNALSFSPSGAFFYSGGDYFVRKWNLKGEPVGTFRGPTTFIWSVSVKDDSSEWIAGSFERNIRLSGFNNAKSKTLSGHTKSVLAVAYSPNGKYMASGSLDENIFLWNAETYMVIDTFKGHGGNIYCVVFSPDGKFLASASNDNTVRLWEVATGTLIRTFNGHSAGVFSVCFSPDGRYLISGSVDTNVMAWEICNGEQVAIFSGHTQAVNEVAFHPSGKYLASASLDKSVTIWEFSKQLIVKHYFADEIKAEEQHSGLFLPRSKDESKINYQQRELKAQELSRQLVEKYYNQYLASIKDVWK